MILSLHCEPSFFRTLLRLFFNFLIYFLPPSPPPPIHFTLYVLSACEHTVAKVGSASYKSRQIWFWYCVTLAGLRSVWIYLAGLQTTECTNVVRELQPLKLPKQPPKLQLKYISSFEYQTSRGFHESSRQVFIDQLVRSRIVVTASDLWPTVHERKICGV